MRFKTVGNKVDKAFCVVRNPSSTVTIPNGAPCYFTMTAAGVLGVDVQDAAAAAGVGQAFFAGIVASEQAYGINSGLAPGYYGEAQCWGFVQSLRLIAQTRASSTASFTTASGAIGDFLAPLTNTLAVSMGTDSTGGTSAVTLTYDAFSDIGSNLTVSLSSASATNVSNVITIPNIVQYPVLAQTFTLSASASSAINALAGGLAGSTGSSGSSILYSTISVNAFLQYL